MTMRIHCDRCGDLGELRPANNAGEGAEELYEADHALSGCNGRVTLLRPPREMPRISTASTAASTVASDGPLPRVNSWLWSWAFCGLMLATLAGLACWQMTSSRARLEHEQWEARIEADRVRDRLDDIRRSIERTDDRLRRLDAILLDVQSRAAARHRK